MFYKLLSTIFLLCLGQQVFAQTCMGDSYCESHLFRVDLNESILSNGGAERLAPYLEKLAQSDFLKEKIVKSYELETISFPHNKEVCETEVADGNPSFASIDCEAQDICADEGLKEEVRSLICFPLPCTVFEGDLQVGACQDITNLYSEKISFPQALELRVLNMKDLSFSYENGKGRICASIENIEGAVSAELNLNTTGTSLQDEAIKVTNILPRLDSARDVCILADIDLSSERPLSNIEIIPQGDEPFISNQMLKDAAQTAIVSGLSGYAKEDVESVKKDLLPALFHPIREGVERGVRDALAEVFEDEISELRNSFEGKSLFLQGKETFPTMNLSNVEIKEKLAVLECAQLRAAPGSIPQGHICLNMIDPHTKEKFDPEAEFKLFFPRSHFSFALGRVVGEVTDTSLIPRLKNLRELMLQEEFDAKKYQDWNDFTSDSVVFFKRAQEEKRDEFLDDVLNPFIERLENLELQQGIKSILEITENLSREGSVVSVGMPEICDLESPSHFIGKSIEGCSAQVYVDIEELNKTFEKMWQEGVMCLKGAGPFQEAENEDESDKGCYMYLGGGLSCHIGAPPKINYNSIRKKYETDIVLKKCYKPSPIPFTSICAFGADFNIKAEGNFSTTDEGDLTLQSKLRSFNIVSGSETGSLAQGESCRRTILERLEPGFAEQISKVFTFPLRELTKEKINFPLHATGKVDMGAGYIGLCLEPGDKP